MLIISKLQVSVSFFIWC